MFGDDTGANKEEKEEKSCNGLLDSAATFTSFDKGFEFEKEKPIKARLVEVLTCSNWEQKNRWNRGRIDPSCPRAFILHPSLSIL